MKQIIAALVVAAAAAPVAAQEWQVARDRFPFIGTRLTLRVAADAPGTLRLIRGQGGEVSVAGRARDGFVSAGLAAGSDLNLTGVGGPFDFLVIVPENVWVEVFIPGRSLSRGVARGESRRWTWGAEGADARGGAGAAGTRGHQASEPGSGDRAAAPPITRWVPGAYAAEAGDPPLYTTFTRDRAPARVVVPDLDVAERVTVRVQGDRFRVLTSRPLSVAEGTSEELEIRPADPMAIVLVIPVSTQDFALELGESTALVFDGATQVILCTPVTEQRLSHGRVWYTFNPLDAGLRCGPDSARRHGG